MCDNEWHHIKSNRLNNHKKKFINNGSVIEKVHFIPKELKKYINELFKKGLSSYDFFRNINRKVPEKSNIRNSTIVYILNTAAAKDKLDIIEYILNNSDEKKKLVNSKCGFMEYTPIFQSAYKGSIRALKLLMSAGADTKLINKNNETVLQSLEEGYKNELSKNRSYEVFITDRYNECRDYINNFKLVNSKKIIKSKIFNNEVSIKIFLDTYNGELSNLIEYISKKDKTKILSDILIEALDLNSIRCNQFISCLSKLADDENYKKYILECILDKNIEDYVNLDAPHAKNKINDIYNKIID